MELFNDLLPDPLPAEPMALASAWLATAIAARQQPNPDAMVLATATASGLPSARIVLCKEFDVELGRVSFVTNYDSRKGRDLAENSRAALVFHWDHSHRQIRVEGIVREGAGLRERRVLRVAQLAAAHRRLGQRAEPAAAFARAAQRGSARSREAVRRARAHARQHQRRPWPRTSRDRPSGAAFTSGPTRSSCGSKALRASTSAPAGHAR